MLNPGINAKTVNGKEFDSIKIPSKGNANMDTSSFNDKLEPVTRETDTDSIVISQNETKMASESSKDSFDNLTYSDTFGIISSNHDNNFCPISWFSEGCCTCYWLR